MALIKCPECGKEVSDKAEVCTNCGFSIKQFMIEKEFNKDAKMYFCPRCGFYYCLGRNWTPHYDDKIKNPMCMDCKRILLEVPIDLGLTPYFHKKGDQSKVAQIKKSFLKNI